MFVYSTAARARSRSRCRSPLFLVLRVLQKRLVAAYCQGAPAQRRDAHRGVGGGDGRGRSCAPTTSGPHHRQGARRHRRRSATTASGPGVLAALLFPSGEVFSVFTVAAVIAVGVAQGPESGLTTGAMVGLHLPRLPLPGADRRVHRDPRPDPDGRRRLAAGARPARDADRDRRPGRRRRAARGPPPHRGGPPHVPLPAPPGQGVDGSEPALVDVTLHDRAGQERRRRRGDRLGQVDAGQAADPPGRSHRRAPCGSPASTCATCAMASLRSTHGDGAAGALPVRHHDPRERALRPPDATDDEVRLAFGELGLDGVARHARRGPGHHASASAASTSRPVSASSSRWPAPTSPTRRASSSTRPPRPSIPPPRPGWPGRSRACRGAAPRSPSPIACRRRPGADWMLVFDRGRLVEEGRHDDLLARRRRLRRAARLVARRHLGGGRLGLTGGDRATGAPTRRGVLPPPTAGGRPGPSRRSTGRRPGARWRPAGRRAPPWRRAGCRRSPGRRR